MEGKKRDIGQLYGYTVCLLAVVTFLFGTVWAVSAYLDTRELPYTAIYRRGPSVVSWESYKLDVLSRFVTEQGSDGAVSLIPAEDSTWQKMFEAEQRDRLALSHQLTRRSLVVSLVTLGVAILLFASHWMWLRSRERIAPSASPRG